MPTLPKLILTAILRGLPFVIIIVSAGIHAVRRRSITSGAICLATVAISVPSVWSIFAHIWLRTHTPEEYGRILLPMTICIFVGWYILSISLAIMLFQKHRKPDNIRVDHSSEVQ